MESMFRTYAFRLKDFISVDFLIDSDANFEVVATCIQTDLVK